MKFLIFVLSATLLTFISCKKSDPQQKTTAEKVLGKWKVSTIVEEESISGTTQIHTYNGLPTDYVDYRVDGKVYYNTFGSLDTFTYRIINDKLLVQDISDSFEIKILTDNTFTEYHHFTGSTYKYTENLYK